MTSSRPCAPAVHYIQTRVVRYHPSVVDLRWRRTVHSCDVCPYRASPAASLTAAGRLLREGLGGWCSAVHFGLCSPVKAVVSSSPAVPSSVHTPTVINVTSVATNGDQQQARPESPPPPPLPAKRRIQIPIIVQQQPSSAGVSRQVTVQPVVPPSVTPVVVAPPAERRETNTIVARSEPEGDESESFLRKKEAELRQKREREKQTDEPRPQRSEIPPADSTYIVSPAVDVKQIGGAGVIAGPQSLNKNIELVPAPTADINTASHRINTTRATTQPIAVTTTTAKATPKVVTAVTSQPVVTTTVCTPVRPVHVTVSRLAPATALNIPQFYFPTGVPAETTVADTLLTKVKEEFEKVENGKVLKNQFAPIMKSFGLPLYWKCPMFNFCGGDKSGHVTLQAALAAWNKLSSSCYDDASKFLRLVAKPGRQFIEFDDFLPLIQDVVDTHPGLIFLQDAPEFHSRYVQTVISRILYTVNRSWSGRITLPEIRKSNFLDTVRRLEVEDDINQITDYFSYEHFYVIYCKFWELDKDHDLLISKEDLSRHNDHAISSRIIERVFSGAVTKSLVDGKLCYKDFVWFLMSEEDKRNVRSVEYWFRCMDLDGDGIISMYEMEYFYEEQVEKMEMLGIETLPFQDCLCQMLDMVRPQEPGRIRLQDLKACSLTPIFFDTFINLDKYLEHEQKDPFASLRDQDSDEPEPTDWERYAAEEYELLVAEEGTADVQQEDVMYEDDFEPDANIDSTKKTPAVTTSPVSASTTSTTSGTTPARSTAATGQTTASRTNKKDDIYDFSSTDVGY